MTLTSGIFTLNVVATHHSLSLMSLIRVMLLLLNKRILIGRGWRYCTLIYLKFSLQWWMFIDAMMNIYHFCDFTVTFHWAHDFWLSLMSRDRISTKQRSSSLLVIWQEALLSVAMSYIVSVFCYSSDACSRCILLLFNVVDQSEGETADGGPRKIIIWKDRNRSVQLLNVGASTSMLL